MAKMNKEIEKIEQGNAWDPEDEVVEIQVKKPLDKVIPVILSGEKWEELRREANELGIGPTTLPACGYLSAFVRRFRHSVSLQSIWVYYYSLIISLVNLYVLN